MENSKSEKIEKDLTAYTLLPLDDNEEQQNSKEKLEKTAVTAIVRDHDAAITEFQTLIHIIKATIGTGILNLPAAVGHAGVVVGPVGLIFIAILTVHCEHLLVICSQTWCKIRGKSRMSFADVGEECMMMKYPNKGWLGRGIVNTCMMLAQFGFCCVYMLFVCRNLQQILANNGKFDVDVKYWILMLLPMYIGFSFIRNLNTLAWLSAVSNLLMIVSFVCIFVHIFGSLHNPFHLPIVAPAHELPMFIASAIFTFESIGLILPLENEMKYPKKFASVLNLGMAFVTFLFVSMGFFGYLSCTDKCKGSITLNLGETILSLISRLTMSVSVFLSYFIQAYVIFSIIESWILSTFEKHELLKRYCIRTGVVIFTGVLASTVPHLDFVISFFGATANTTLSITLPAVLHSLSSRNLSKLSLLKNIFIVLFGIFMNIIGTKTIIERTFQVYEQPAKHVRIII